MNDTLSLAQEQGKFLAKQCNTPNKPLNESSLPKDKFIVVNGVETF